MESKDKDKEKEEVNDITWINEFDDRSPFDIIENSKTVQKMTLYYKYVFRFFTTLSYIITINEGIFVTKCIDLLLDFTITPNVSVLFSNIKKNTLLDNPPDLRDLLFNIPSPISEKEKEKEKEKEEGEGEEEKKEKERKKEKEKEKISSIKSIQSDSIIILNQLVLFLNICLSIYISYNLYYVIYINVHKNGLLDCINNIELHYPHIQFIIKYLVCPIKTLLLLLYIYIPSFITNYISIENDDGRVHYMVLFFMILGFIHFFGTMFLNSSNTIYVTLYVYIFILYGIYTAINDLHATVNKNHKDIAMKYSILGSFTPVLYLILFIVRIIWSVSQIQMMSFFNCIYMLSISLLSLPSTGNFSIFSQINAHIRKNDTSVLINFFYTYLYEIIFLFFFITSAAQISNSISNTTLQITLFILVSLCIILISGILYLRCML
jgi:hypothetical protein